MLELVQTFGIGFALSRHRRVSTMDDERMAEHFCYPSNILSYMIGGLGQSVVFSYFKYWHMSSVFYSNQGTWAWLGNLQKQCTFGNQGVSSQSEEAKKVAFMEF
jgi:hypothetical protein